MPRVRQCRGERGGHYTPSESHPAHIRGRRLPEFPGVEFAVVQANVGEPCLGVWNAPDDEKAGMHYRSAAVFIRGDPPPRLVWERDADGIPRTTWHGPPSVPLADSERLHEAWKGVRRWGTKGRPPHRGTFASAIDCESRMAAGLALLAQHHRQVTQDGLAALWQTDARQIRRWLAEFGLSWAAIVARARARAG